MKQDMQDMASKGCTCMIMLASRYFVGESSLPGMLEEVLERAH